MTLARIDSRRYTSNPSEALCAKDEIIDDHSDLISILCNI